MPGKLIHTNEIMVLLGDNWFAERSASQALEIVTRRKKYLENNIAGINEDLKGFESRLKFASEIQSAAEENSDVKEIKEELSPQEEQRLLNRGSRKAHPKASKLGGSKKVEGFTRNLKDRVANKEKEAQQPSSEELSLFARLDELEEKEAINAELDQLWQDDSCNEESRPKIGFEKREDDKRLTLSKSEDTNQTKKKVTWETLDIKDDTVVNSNDSSESENGDDEDVQRTISVRFSSSSSSSLQGQVEKQLSKQPTVITTPADIYSQFTPKQELKSILRKPSVEEKEHKISSEDRIPTTQQLPTNITKENKEKEDFNSQKAFTGTIVEKPASQKDGQETSQMGASQPGKKLSRFKAARQNQQ
ncbi:uncharacterized protein LOC144649523 isoform X2 [Oculina patagonica]